MTAVFPGSLEKPLQILAEINTRLRNDASKRAPDEFMGSFMTTYMEDVKRVKLALTIEQKAEIKSLATSLQAKVDQLSKELEQRKTELAQIRELCDHEDDWTGYCVNCGSTLPEEI